MNQETVFEILKRQLRPRLRELLESENIIISKNGMLQCINPQHMDKNASMRLLPDSNEEQLWCFGCLKKDERIFTTVGWKEIQYINIGDMVIDVSGKLTKVSRVIPKQAIDPIIRIKTSTDNIGLFATADHTMLWVPDPISARGSIRSDYRKITKIYEAELKDLREGQWVPTAIIKEDGNVKNTIDIKTPTKEHSFNLHDKDLAWILGLYAAEGSASSGRSVFFSIHENEVAKFKPRLESWTIKNLNAKVEVSRSKKSKGVDLIVSSVLLSNLVIEIIGTGCENKKCPDAILRGPLDAAASWLIGLLEGDGSKSDNSLTVTSQDLTDAMFHIALRCGAIPSRRGLVEKKDKKITYSTGLLYNSYKEIIAAANGGAFEPQEKAHKNACIISLPELGWVLLSRIESISSTGKYPIVYDLTTESGTFTTTTMSVHNCSTTGDVFTAHNWLKKAPLSGPEFLEDNVYKLADRFNIQYEKILFTEEQIARIEQFRFNSIVAERLTLKNERGEPINWTDKYCIERGWISRVCEELRISTILDYNKLLRDIQQVTGLTIKECQEKGLTTDLFGPDFITITLYDERSRIVGFTARNLKWTPEEKSSVPKYKNTSHNCVFYKGRILYGMNLVRTSKHRRLDIFEGNGSFVVAYGAGHNSCVSLCGSSLSDDQIKLIIDMGFTHINLVLDQDKTGRSKTNEYMQKLSGIEGLRVECTSLPFNGEDNDLKDPEDFIKKYGIGSFFKIKPVGAFDWYIEKEAEDIKTGVINSTEFINKMIKVLINTPNRIERAKQRSKLSTLTGVAERDIEAEIDRIVKVSLSDVKYVLAKRIAGASSTEDINTIITEAKSAVESSLETKSVSQSLSTDEVIKGFDDIVSTLDNRKAGLQGWQTGYGLIDLKLSGIPKPIGTNAAGETIPAAGSLVGFPGIPQSGKSVMLQNLALNIARKNPDVTVLYWCLDDSRQRVLERMLSMASGVPWREVTRRAPISPENKAILDENISMFRELIYEGKILHKDHANGSSLSTLFRWTEMVQEKYGRPILAVIDSFHKIHAAENESNMQFYALTKRMCERLKSFSQTHNVTIMASIEMTKGQARGIEPELLHMAEARKIEYDFDVLCTVYNHYYDMDGQSDQVIRLPGGGIKPLIKVNIRKSKEGGTGPIYFALNTQNFTVRDYSIDDILRITGTSQVEPIDIGGLKISSPDAGNLVKTKSKYSGSNSSMYFPWEEE